MLLDNLDDDFEWYKRDPVGYMTEQNRRDSIVEDAVKKFMGPEFKQLPLKTADEVKHSIEERSMRLLRLQQLKAPKLLVDNEQRMLEESLSVFQKGEYAVTTSEKEYKDRYWEKYNEFFSQDHKWDWNKDRI